MTGKVKIFVLLAAVAVVLYFLFRPGGVLNSATPGTATGVHAASPFTAALAGFSSLGTSLVSLLGGGGGAGSSTPTGSLPTVSAAAATNTPAQNAAYAYATSEINNTNIVSQISPIDAPIPTSVTEDYSDLINPGASSSYDYSADEDSSGAIFS